MLLKFRQVVFLIVAVGLGTAVAIFCFGFLGNEDAAPQAWVSAGSAAIATMALAISTLGFLIAEQRAKFSNAFEIARRFEEQPMLGAREDMREYLSDLDALIELVGAKRLQATFAHLANFYWNMAVAVETGWTDDEYLKIRFKPSLEQFYPVIFAFIYYRHSEMKDPGASPALISINKLCRTWGLDNVVRKAEEHRRRGNTAIEVK